MAEATEPRRSSRNKPSDSNAAASKPVAEPKPNVSKKRTKEAEEPSKDEKSTEDTSSTKKSKTSPTKLAVGDKLPSITLKDDKDVDVDVSTLENVVFFIYPKADTPGCTTQACNFRDGYSDFEDLGFKVYGLSADTVAAQSKWSTKHTLGYPLLSDREKQLLTAFGCIQAGKLTRSHVIIGKEGKIELLSVGVKPANSKVDCFEMVKKLKDGSDE